MHPCEHGWAHFKKTKTKKAHRGCERYLNHIAALTGLNLDSNAFGLRSKIALTAACTSVSLVPVFTHCIQRQAGLHAICCAKHWQYLNTPTQKQKHKHTHINVNIRHQSHKHSQPRILPIYQQFCIQKSPSPKKANSKFS